MDRSQGERIAAVLAVLACFAVLAWLNGRYVGSGAGQVATYTLLGLLLAIACLAGLAGLVLAASPSLRPAGYRGALDAVSRGFLIVIPFTALALLADLAFGWNAATAFVQAAIMTSGAAVGVEVMRGGDKKLRYLAVCTAGAFAFSMAWIGFSALFTKAAG